MTDQHDNRSVVMVFRATPAEREAVEQRAIRDQQGISEVLRRAVAHYLEEFSCAGRPSETTQGCSDGD